MPTIDTYEGRADISSQGESWAGITPSDSANLQIVPKALWVDVAGTLKLTGEDGNAVTFTVSAGPVPLRPIRVWATGTSATGITGIY